VSGYIGKHRNILIKSDRKYLESVKTFTFSVQNVKKVLLIDSLNGHSSSPLFEIISSFFEINAKDKLKELRYLIVDDLCEYLKPAKKERQKENYTSEEREKQSFDLSYTEPSPFWRYNYVRALDDFRVKTDNRGHFFMKYLRK
jgi:hypothetical protein